RAVFVPPNDTDALEQAINGLIDDPWRRQELAAAARERALEYSPERMTEEYLAAYGEVLAAAGRLFPEEPAYPAYSEPLRQRMAV
ncbi:MAG TPA: hypothetical protein VEL74_01530, partial [Thermoanaerobaculia bacterium]|nr:hypothetical protein [Thermoanaerobaculia bacterium]